MRPSPPIVLKEDGSLADPLHLAVREVMRQPIRVDCQLLLVCFDRAKAERLRDHVAWRGDRLPADFATVLKTAAGR